MEPYKSLIIANKVLADLVQVDALKECQYHSFYSGSTSPDGLCGYAVYGKKARSIIKVIFYGTNKDVSTPVHIFILVDGKSKVRGTQLSVDNAVKFIVDKVTKFMTKTKA